MRHFHSSSQSPSIEALVIVNLWDTLNLNVFNNYKRILKLYCFCSLLSNCYQALLWTGPISFPANYKFFLLVSVLSDYIMTLLRFVF